MNIPEYIDLFADDDWCEIALAANSYSGSRTAFYRAALTKALELRPIPTLPVWTHTAARRPTFDDGDEEGRVLWSTRHGALIHSHYSDHSSSYYKWMNPTAILKAGADDPLAEFWEWWESSTVDDKTKMAAAGWLANKSTAPA